MQAKCERCKQVYDPTKLTEWARGVYVNTCGPCIFNIVDSIAIEATISDCYTDGGGILDYLPCSSDYSDEGEDDN